MKEHTMFNVIMETTMLFIDDQSVNRMLEIAANYEGDSKSPAWRLFWRILNNRNLRWEYFF